MYGELLVIVISIVFLTAKVQNSNETLKEKFVVHPFPGAALIL